MTELEDKANLDKIVFDDNNQEKKSWSSLGQTCSRSLFVFLSQLIVILSSTLDAFGELVFQKIVTNRLFGLKFCAVRQNTFYLHQGYQQAFSTKNRVFTSMVGLSETGKSQLIYNWLKIGTFQPKVDKGYFLIIISNLFTMLCKKEKKSRVCARSKL